MLHASPPVSSKTSSKPSPRETLSNYSLKSVDQNTKDRITSKNAVAINNRSIIRSVKLNTRSISFSVPRSNRPQISTNSFKQDFIVVTSGVIAAETRLLEFAIEESPGSCISAEFLVTPSDQKWTVFVPYNEALTEICIIWEQHGRGEIHNRKLSCWVLGAISINFNGPVITSTSFDANYFIYQCIEELALLKSTFPSKDVATLPTRKLDGSAERIPSLHKNSTGSSEANSFSPLLKEKYLGRIDELGESAESLPSTEASREAKARSMEKRPDKKTKKKKKKSMIRQRDDIEIDREPAGDFLDGRRLVSALGSITQTIKTAMNTYGENIHSLKADLMEAKNLSQIAMLRANLSDYKGDGTLTRKVDPAEVALLKSHVQNALVKVDSLEDLLWYQARELKISKKMSKQALAKVKSEAQKKTKKAVTKAREQVLVEMRNKMKEQEMNLTKQLHKQSMKPPLKGAIILPPPMSLGQAGTLSPKTIKLLTASEYAQQHQLADSDGNSVNSLNSGSTSSLMHAGSSIVTAKVVCEGNFRVRFRSAASTTAPTVGYLYSGEVVDMFAEAVDGFYQLCGGRGYVLSDVPGVSWEIISTSEASRKVDRGPTPGYAKPIGHVNPALLMEESYEPGYSFARAQASIAKAYSQEELSYSESRVSIDNSVGMLDTTVSSTTDLISQRSSRSKTSERSKVPTPEITKTANSAVTAPLLWADILGDASVKAASQLQKS